jgi:hypothetical protein
MNGPEKVDLYNFLTVINKHTVGARMSEVGRTLQSVYSHVLKWHHGNSLQEYAMCVWVMVFPRMQNDMAVTMYLFLSFGFGE